MTPKIEHISYMFRAGIFGAIKLQTIHMIVMPIARLSPTVVILLHLMVQTRGQQGKQINGGYDV